MGRLNVHAVLVVLQLSSVLSLLVVVPENTATVVGQIARFSCQTDSGGQARWLLNDLHSNTVTYTIYDGSTVANSFSPKISVNRTVLGQFDLIISDTQRYHAGTYTCLEVNTGLNASAIHIIVVPSLSCTASPPITGDVYINTALSFQCSLSFNGSMWQRPQMTWYWNGQVVSTSSSVVEIISGGHLVNVVVKSNISQQAAPPTVNYTCRVHFTTVCQSSDQPPGLSQSIPIYAITWNTAVVYVRYPVRNITISGATSNGMFNVIYINQSLTCRADGYPPPQYQWLDTGTGQNVDGSDIVMTRTSATVQTFRCTASNVLDSTHSYSLNASISVLVQIGPETSTTTTTTTTTTSTTSAAATTTLIPGLSSVTSTPGSSIATPSRPATTVAAIATTTTVNPELPIIIGCVVGGASLIVVVIIIAVAVICCKRRRHGQDHPQQQPDGVHFDVQHDSAEVRYHGVSGQRATAAAQGNPAYSELPEDSCTSDSEAEQHVRQPNTARHPAEPLQPGEASSNGYYQVALGPCLDSASVYCGSPLYSAGTAPPVKPKPVIPPPRRQPQGGVDNAAVANELYEVIPDPEEDAGDQHDATDYEILGTSEQTNNVYDQLQSP